MQRQHGPVPRCLPQGSMHKMWYRENRDHGESIGASCVGIAILRPLILMIAVLGPPDRLKPPSTMHLHLHHPHFIPGAVTQMTFLPDDACM